MNSVFEKKYISFTIPVVIGCFLICFTTVFLRIESVKLGYEIGNLKSQERQLLEDVSRLEMNLAIMSTKKNLVRYAKVAEK